MDERKRRRYLIVGTREIRRGAEQSSAPDVGLGQLRRLYRPLILGFGSGRTPRRESPAEVLELVRLFGARLSCKEIMRELLKAHCAMASPKARFVQGSDSCRIDERLERILLFGDGSWCASTRSHLFSCHGFLRYWYKTNGDFTHLRTFV